MSKCDFKIVLLGNEHVGKTSLVLRFMRCTFNTTTPYQSTVGAAFCSKRMRSKDQDVTIGIWDTAGSERYESMSRLYYRDAQAAVICYDPTCRYSWERLRHWLQQVRAVEEDCKLYLCGTKKDLMDSGEAVRAIPEETVALYSQGLCGHLLTSSKTGENVEELFQMIVDDLVNDKKFMKTMEENRQVMERDMLRRKLKSKDHCVCSLQ